MTKYFYELEDDIIYEKLQTLLQKRSLILFAGSGLSRQALTTDGKRPPLWKGLLEGLTDWAVNQNFLDDELGNEINNLVLNGYFIEAGQELQEVLPKSQLHKGLTEILLCNKAVKSEAHEIMVKIPFRGYITTNYDELIESFYRYIINKPILKLYERTMDGVLDAYNDKIPFVFKIHGDINDPETIILGNRSYEKLLYFDRRYTTCLESIINTSSFLFVGFGGSDPDLEGIISRCAAFNETRRHWLLASQNTFPKLKAKRLLKDKGINVIFYEPDATHSKIIWFFQKLSTHSTP